MRLNVIGCGRAGGTVASALLQTGLIEIGQVMNLSLGSAKAAVAALGAGRAIAQPSDFSDADIWLISTADGEIANSAIQLAASRENLDDCLAFHLSGRFGPEVLRTLREAGAHTAAVHPVRSMPRLSTQADEFIGTICVAEGDAPALATLERLFLAAGAGWHEVTGLDRGLYHAALAIISNVTKGVIWKAQNWLEASGLHSETAAAVSHSLLSITTEDVFREGARHSITGPVVRGDTSTVEAHIKALKKVGRHDAETYRVLARTVLELANERGDLSEEALQRFEILLSEAEN